MSKFTIEIDGVEKEFQGYEVKPYTVKQGERPLVPPNKKEVVWSRLVLFSKTHAMEFEVTGNIESYGAPFEIVTLAGGTRLLYFKTMPYTIPERTNEVAYTIEHPDPAKRNIYKEIHHKKNTHAFPARAILPRLLTVEERQRLGAGQPANVAVAKPTMKKTKAGPGRNKVYDSKTLKRITDMRKTGSPLKDIAREMNLRLSQIRKMIDAHRKQQMRRQ